jgi:hypothetical protein
MKAIAFAFTASTLLATVTVAQDKKPEEKGEMVPCEVDRLNKSWNLTLKSAYVKVVMKDSLGDTKFKEPKMLTELRVTLEFAREPGSVDQVRRVFLTESMLPKPGQPALKESHVQLYVHDAENVVLGKFNPQAIEGEITGKKGDAFRLVFYCDPAFAKKVKKLDLRPSDDK